LYSSRGGTGLVFCCSVGLLFGSIAMKVLALNAFRPCEPGEQAQGRDALIDAAFSIMGHLSKADGRVSEQEIAQAEAMMARMQLSAEQRQRAIGQFQRGKQADFPLDDTVAAFRQATRYRKHMILVFLEMLLQTALADGTLHE